MNIIALSEERDMETSYGYCNEYQPHAVRRMFDSKHRMLYDMRWDKAGNLGQVSIARPGDMFETGRFLFWTEDSRMHAAVDDRYYSYYAYDHSGGSCASREQSQACLSYAEMEQRRRSQRRLKLTGDSKLLDVNADIMATYTFLDNPTLYPSAYMVLTNKGYTKHYYAGTERVAARLGGGGLNALQPVIANDDELQKKADILFRQSLDHVNHRVLGENDLKCIMNNEFARDEFGKRIDGIPYHVRSDVKVDNWQFKDMVHSMLYDRNQGHEKEVFFYHSDHLGSASWITDFEGIAVQHLQYLPYGEPYIDQRAAGTTYRERFRFTGKERDEETGYGYFGARYMDHELMTMWLSVDPMSDKYPSISPYAYCAWNPVRLIDPNGMEAMEGWPPQRFKEKWNKLNRQEQNVLLYDIRFMKALTMDENSGLAVAETKKQYGRNGKGDESDAFRHAYWQALNTQDVGEDFTRKMSDAHEYSTPAKEVDSDLIMDIHNNDLGIQVGRENPQASPAELISIIKSKMDAGELLIINKDGKLVKSNGKPLAESEIRRLSKSHEIKNDILLHRKTKVEGSKYE